LKENQEFRRFLLRGTEKVSTEWGLLAFGYNMKTGYRDKRGYKTGIIPGQIPGKTKPSSSLSSDET
jgi:hypothetical protein